MRPNFNKVAIAVSLALATISIIKSNKAIHSHRGGAASIAKQLKDIKNQNKKLQSHCLYLNFVINSTCDITKCKPAKGLLREAQLVRFRCLKLVTKILEKNGVKTWLEYGTLIGAYRHKGFIPWDDDIDIGILKKDYYKAKEILNKAFQGTEFVAQIGGKGTASSVLKVRDKTTKFCYIDIFPFELCNLAKEVNIKEYEQRVKDIVKEFRSKCTKDPAKIEQDIIEKAEIIQQLYVKENIEIKKDSCNFMICAIESQFKVKPYADVHFTKNIFPLKKIEFEGETFYAPNNTLAYLSESYEGKYGNIMSFPTGHIAGHPLKNYDGNKKFKLEFEQYNKNLDVLEQKVLQTE